MAKPEAITATVLYSFVHDYAVLYSKHARVEVDWVRQQLY